MYTTCIFCAADLGRNEAFEAFPVGKRLAFDEARGRLWVVCRKCERWNLSPLEERWEAIEACERRYREARLRTATDNIGMARLREGVDLIRIGEPMRPEFAAWRYGDQFGRRRRRQLALTGAVVGAAGAVIAGGAAVGISVGSFAGVYANAGLWDALVHGRGSKVVARIRPPGGGAKRLPSEGASARGVDGGADDECEPLVVQRRHARMSSLLLPDGEDGPLALRLEHAGGRTVLTGETAERAAQQLLPVVNRFGGTKRAIGDAVGYIEAHGGPEAAMRALRARRGVDADATLPKRNKRYEKATITVEKLPGVLHALEAPERLALEMALHEESERRAMHGELHLLEAAWRDAEEIAGIADRLTLPEGTDAELERLRERAADGTPEAAREVDAPTTGAREASARARRGRQPR